MISDQTKGLYAKYSVKRLNDHGGKHTNCPFFVLEVVSSSSRGDQVY